MKDKRCPTCDAPAAEASIRRNRALEEIADSWEEARYVQSWLTTLKPDPSLYNQLPVMLVHRESSQGLRTTARGAAAMTRPHRKAAAVTLQAQAK